jgi:hypothetical protein
MKKYLKLLYLAPMALFIASCDNGFEEMNVNPNASTDVVPGFLFTRAQLTTVANNYTGAAYLTIGQSMQHFATYKEVPAAGDKYFNYGYSNGSWALYGGDPASAGAVIDVEQVIGAVKTAPEDVNKLSVARIWRAYLYHRLTDLYGDIPYSEAGKALTDKNFTPKYDTQASIYADLLKEIDESIGAFDAAKATFGNSDLVYGGDVTKWKNSVIQ